MRTKKLVMVVGGLVAFFFTSPVHADDDRVSTKDTERGYAYTFDDDPLDAAPEGARGARISVRPLGKRTILIRPRTHFIRELFQSAEDL